MLPGSGFKVMLGIEPVVFRPSGVQIGVIIGCAMSMALSSALLSFSYSL